MPPKGEFEITYFGGPDNPSPCGGVNYSVPYTSLPPNDLAPGSVNTQSISGFLCSSPWVANSPYASSFAAGEYIQGVFEGNFSGGSGLFPSANNLTFSLIVTNLKVYVGTSSPSQASQLPLIPLSVVHTWAGGEKNSAYQWPGQQISFIQASNNIFLTGLMLTGIFVYNVSNGTFQQATSYVCGRFISELAGRLVVAECIFPGGGGTGTFELPTIAWSGVGIFGQAWDLNPAHDVWNPANQAFFNGNIGGFNQLTDVPDQITGLGTVGQSLIVVRKNGITQQDPNSTFSNSGIQPYNWYHMWASPQGVGGYPGTVAQYGQILAMLSSDNAYTLSMTGGLQPLAPKIISKINNDRRTVENLPGVLSASGTKAFYSFWYFSSMYVINGQLHYLISFNAYTTDPSATPSLQNTNCLGYDLNTGDGSWHVWDFSQYYQQSSIGAGFLGFSCCLYRQTPAVMPLPTANFSTITNPRLLLFGAFTSYGPVGSPSLTGVPLHLVPFEYDVVSNPITNYVALLYVPVSVPSATVVFRGETLSLGHKISTRRLRLQTNNAPMPTLVANNQQQAQVTFRGPGAFSTANSPVLSINGNTLTQGLSIKTTYGDAVLSDEMVQPSLTSAFNATSAWQTLCAFRISSASFIGIDTTGSTQ